MVQNYINKNFMKDKIMNRQDTEDISLLVLWDAMKNFVMSVEKFLKIDSQFTKGCCEYFSKFEDLSPNFGILSLWQSRFRFKCLGIRAIFQMMKCYLFLRYISQKI